MLLLGPAIVGILLLLFVWCCPAVLRAMGLQRAEHHCSRSRAVRHGVRAWRMGHRASFARHMRGRRRVWRVISPMHLAFLVRLLVRRRRRRAQLGDRGPTEVVGHRWSNGRQPRRNREQDEAYPRGAELVCSHQLPRVSTDLPAAVLVPGRLSWSSPEPRSTVQEQGDPNPALLV